MASRLNPVQLIVQKRDGAEHSAEEIRTFIDGFVTGAVTDYQMSAWLMAGLLQGLSQRETAALTNAMLHSGKVLQLRSIRAPKVDKHSTGGVGDKISICLAPLVACCGAAVPMISGRGLGHTGGTLDKLEAIEGYSAGLDIQRFERIVRQVGTSLIGQTRQLAPADAKIYALRDVTGTVESIPFIVASILSKKLAEGVDALVLDVKVGSGAFMKDLESARQLARSLVRTGRRGGKKVVALLTRMSTPLGTTIGNALETREAIDVLRGEGPEDTLELTLALGTEMLLAAGVERRPQRATKRLSQALWSGAALDKLAAMVQAHGGDPRCVYQPDTLPRAPHRIAVAADTAGAIRRCDALQLGQLAVELGAGRTRADQGIDPAVGIELAAKPGNRIETGQPLAWLHVRNRRGAERLIQRARAAFVIGRRAPSPEPLIYERITR